MVVVVARATAFGAVVVVVLGAAVVAVVVSVDWGTVLTVVEELDVGASDGPTAATRLGLRDAGADDRRVRRSAAVPTEEVEHEQWEARQRHHEGDDQPALRRVHGGVQSGVLRSATRSRPWPEAAERVRVRRSLRPEPSRQPRRLATQLQLSTRRRDIRRPPDTSTGRGGRREPST